MGALSSGVSQLFSAWQTYAMVAAGIAGMFLVQNAMQAGKIVVAQPGITLLDPFVAILWGVIGLREQTSGSGLHLDLAATGGLLMSSARSFSPAHRSSGTAGSGPRVEGSVAGSPVERLAGRGRRAVPSTGCPARAPLSGRLAALPEDPAPLPLGRPAPNALALAVCQGVLEARLTDGAHLAHGLRRLRLDVVVGLREEDLDVHSPARSSFAPRGGHGTNVLLHWSRRKGW